MASYKIRFKRSSERDLRNIDSQHIPKIIDAVEALAENAFPPQFRKIRSTRQLYRIRMGDYRIISSG